MGAIPVPTILKRYYGQGVHHDSLQKVATYPLRIVAPKSAFADIQFYASQDEIGNACEDQTKFKANVHTEGRVNQISDGTDEKMVSATNSNYLCSTQDDTYQPNCQRDDGGPANRKFAWCIPIIYIIFPASEDKVL